MTFDDGIVKIYVQQNMADKGDMPKLEEVLKGEYFFAYETVGFQRYWTAAAHNKQIEAVIDIDLDRTISNNDIVEFEDGTKMNVIQTQHAKDEDGLWFTRLTLEQIAIKG